VLGNGKKLFGYGAKPAAFTLVDNKVTTKGVTIARYQRAGAVVTIMRWIHRRRRKSRGASGSTVRADDLLPAAQALRCPLSGAKQT
jgi:hypothetical protein